MPLQFQNPIILWGFISLILPIVIHLFNFKRFKPVYFSNLTFLKDITNDNKNRSKIKSWLLLLTRLLALSSLIVAFAQPYIPSKHTTTINTKQKNTAHIYIDNSFSMNAETEKGIALEIAKNKAIELVNSFSDDTQIKIIDNDKKGQLEFLNRTNAILKIQDIEPSSMSQSFSQIIQKASQSELSANNKIYLLSDFQKYQADFENMPNDSSLNISLLPIVIQSKNNLYLDSCWFENSTHQINQKEELKVRISNSSNKGFQKIPIKLYINDSLKTVSNFDIEPKANKEINLHFKNRKHGIYSGRVEIDDYPITYDNKLFFSFQIQRNIELISVNQDEENQYINSLFSEEQNFKLKNTSKSQFHQEDLNQTKLIILNQLLEMQSGFRQKISNYINQGGHVLIIPNENNNESNNELLTELGSNLFMQLDTSNQNIANIELNAEIYTEVFDKLKTDARLPLVFQHFKLSKPGKNISIPLWKSKSGENLFSQTSIGEGKLYTSTFKFDRKWTNAMKHPIFVPSLINMAVNKKSQTPVYFNLNSEKYIPTNGLNNSKKAIFHIENKALGINLIPEQIAHFDKGLLLNIHGQIKDAGNYFLSQAQQILSGISFNYDRQESKLDFYSLGEIKSLLEAHKLNYSVFDLSLTDLKTMVVEQKEGKSFWRLFLILSFIFLLVELLIQKVKFF